jgi:DNA-directed RNA polymerase subunit K/omega
MDSSDEISNVLNNYEKNKKNYKTNPKITLYEKTRVLSERASQIDNGSIIYFKNPERFENSYQIACKEYELRLIPFIIKRKIGNNYEYWKLEDLL